jgi:hypothetical protein
MSLALLMALSILQAGDASAAQPQPDASAAAQPAPDASASVQATATTETEDVPMGAPSDDYGFVSWCYGALDEYLAIYPKVLPDLKDIDKAFGSPVQEDVPYAKDVALEHKALDRFAAAMQAAQKASSQPIADQGQAAVAQGRGIWSKVEALPSRQLADAWLFWGVPVRCETTAKALTDHARETHASN